MPPQFLGMLPVPEQFRQGLHSAVAESLPVLKLKREISLRGEARRQCQVGMITKRLEIRNPCPQAALAGIAQLGKEEATAPFDRGIRQPDVGKAHQPCASDVEVDILQVELLAFRVVDNPA